MLSYKDFRCTYEVLVFANLCKCLVNIISFIYNVDITIILFRIRKEAENTMGVFQGIIIIILIIVIAFLGYQIYTKNYHYQYKVNKMDAMESDYQSQIQALQSTIKELNETAFTHTVTKIGNIDYFIDRCSAMFDRYPLARFDMVGFSISNMGKINQMFGPAEGDKVMIYTANILRSGLLTGTTYAHVNSNLFGILFKDSDSETIIKAIDAITEKLAEYSPTFAVTASFGIYTIDHERASDSLMDIMNCTLLAQKSIKDPSRCNYAYFTEELNRTYNENHQMSQEMEEALDGHKFIVYLQPMVDLHSYQIVSAEALVRWDYPGKGILSPYAFLPLFESSSLIQKLDYYMWEECCKLIRRWIDNKITPLPLCMNISPIHLQSTSFIDILEQFMNQYLISKDLLILELPERGVANASKETAEIIGILKERGFSLCIDNFGSVHSPLNLLKDYPIERIKLDRSFLNRNSNSDEGLTILRYLIAMAKELDLTVITEGVETMEQANFLVDIGCDIAQGYFFAKPLTVRLFDQLNKSMLRTLYRPSEYYPTFDDFEKDVDILTQMMQRIE